MSTELEAERKQLLEELYILWVASVEADDYKTMAQIIVRLGKCDPVLGEMYIEDLVKRTRNTGTV